MRTAVLREKVLAADCVRERLSVGAPRTKQRDSRISGSAAGKFDPSASSDISKRHEAPITLHQPIAHCPCRGQLSD